MRRAIAATAVTAGLVVGSAGVLAGAGTVGAAESSTTNDPNDIEAVNNPVDDNDDDGFDDWGLLGLLGLLGLAGLAKRNKPVERTVYTGTNDPPGGAGRL